MGFRAALPVFLSLLALTSSGCSKRLWPAATPRRPAIIVAFGDSLTYGLGVARLKNYPARLQARLGAQGYGYEVVDAGISGETTAHALKRLDSICALDPAIVIVEFGLNDRIHGMSHQTTCRNLAKIVNRLELAHARVVLAGMRLSSNCGPDPDGRPHNLYAEVAKDLHAQLIPDFLKGVEGNRRLNQKDGMHPTAAGYRLIVNNVWTVLKPMLSRPRGDAETGEISQFR